MNMEFAGKLAVITGSASGIGRSVALALARLGTDTVIADRNDARLGNVRQEIESMGRRVLAVHCDVTKNNDVENLVAQTVSTFGTPDILMNNAGTGAYGNLEDMGIAHYEIVLDINVLGVIRGVLAFLPYMLEKGSGYIINTASRAGFTCDARPYSLSKSALISYSEGLYCQLRPRGIMVSVLCPAMVDTNMLEHSYFVGTEQEINELRSRMLRKEGFGGVEFMNPDDVAQMVINAMNEKRFLILTPDTEDVMAEAMKRGRDFNKLEQYLQDTVTG